MRRRESIRNHVSKNSINDMITIQYCNVDNCPSPSLYQCNYCDEYRCIRHIKSMGDDIYMCHTCINGDQMLYDIFGASQINKNTVPPLKRKLIYCCSMEWISCNKSKVHPYP